MIKFILGVIVGFVLSTIGVGGAAHLVNKAVPVVDAKVAQAQHYLKDQAK